MQALDQPYVSPCSNKHDILINIVPAYVRTPPLVMNTKPVCSGRPLLCILTVLVYLGTTLPFTTAVSVYPRSPLLPYAAGVSSSKI